MAVKRIVDVSFWTDGKVDEFFSPEDKYFMLYLLTNPFTTQLGIYEISIGQVAYQLGYSKEAVKVLLERFEGKYEIILYSKETNEVAVKNFLRHSIIKGGAPVRDCLIKELKSVKNRALIDWVFSNIKGYENLNETVKNIISEYEEKNGVLYYSNDKQNDNDNENDVSYHDSFNDSSNVSLKKSSKPTKHKYGEYKNVLLTDEELEKLKTEYSDCEERIERLSSYVASTGKSYKSHYATIRNWARKDKDKPVRKEIVPAWMSKPNKFHNYQQSGTDYDAIVSQNDPLMRTAANDEGIRERAEALKRQFAGT